MCNYIIKDGIVINDTAAVLSELNFKTSKNIKDLGAMKRFANEEKNTLFYLDESMKSSMQCDRSSKYLWIDTGYQDSRDNPIFVALTKNHSGFEGHIVGTMAELARSLKQRHPGNKTLIDSNLTNFKRKYDKKEENREHAHICDDHQYLIEKCNSSADCTAPSLMALCLQSLGMQFPDGEVDDEFECEETCEAIEEDDEFETEITLGLLLDHLGEMEDYIQSLLNKIEELNQKYDAKDADVEALKAQNKEFKKAMVDIRTFVQEEDERMLRNAEMSDESVNHKMLQNKKILVLGDTCIKQNDMTGIAKTFGFKKKDFEFVTDYEKVVNYSGRIRNEGRYYAVVFGAHPHSVNGLGNYNSLIEKCKAMEDMPLCIDARSKSGELKVTKESFKMAMKIICEGLALVLAS